MLIPRSIRIEVKKAHPFLESCLIWICTVNRRFLEIEFLIAFKFKQLCRSSPSAHTRGLAPNPGISQVKFLLQRRFRWNWRGSLAKSKLRSTKESSRTTAPSAGLLGYAHGSLTAFSYRDKDAHYKLAASLRLVRSYHRVGRFRGNQHFQVRLVLSLYFMHRSLCLQIPYPLSLSSLVTSPITSWQIDVETVADFIFFGSNITADGDCSHEIKRHCLEVKL